MWRIFVCMCVCVCECVCVCVCECVCAIGTGGFRRELIPECQNYEHKYFKTSYRPSSSLIMCQNGSKSLGRTFCLQSDKLDVSINNARLSLVGT